MNETVLRSLIPDPLIEVKVMEEVPSTNETVKSEARKGAPEGLLVTARRQSAGKGRMGRGFYSPADTGLYMSLLLRPQKEEGGKCQKLSMREVMALTPMAAVAGAEAIDEIRGEEGKKDPCRIKWVNDLYLHGKKVAGILAEGSVDPNAHGSMDYVVLGIGVDLKAPENGFPKEISDVAGGVFEEEIPEAGAEKLAACFVKRFMEYYRVFLRTGKRDYMSAYRERSNLIGRRVILLDSADHLPISGGFLGELPKGDSAEGTVTVKDIGPEGQLVVQIGDGTILELSSGEVSVRTTD